MEYRCPHCKTVVTGSAPIKGAMEDKAFCPACGKMFDKGPNQKK
jgi:DNA-directed RNA polymerase subunit RPC12/RpoP